MKYIASMRALMGMASQESHKWLIASYGTVGEAGDIARGFASKSRAESATAMIYLIQMIIAMGIKVADIDF